MQGHILRSSVIVDTDAGHTAFTDIKNQLALLDENLETVLEALPHAVEDGLSDILAQEAKVYLDEIQALLGRMKSIHLKAHAKFRIGIETAPTGSKFSGRAPT